MDSEKVTSQKLSRRDFLGAAVMVSSASSMAAAVSTFDPAKDEWQPDRADAIRPVTGNDYLFFTHDEAALVARLVDCIIPADELGPGADEAGVTFFLDRQLDGDYGRAYSWYMQGPWPEGLPTQGYQTRLTPAMMYRQAIAAIDVHSIDVYKKNFVQLSTTEQNEVVTAMENEQVDLNGVPKKTFFDQLLQNVVEGYFSDPIYGGNRNMAGWKMIGFPGTRYNYRMYVSKHGEKFSFDPVGLMGGPNWRVKA